MRPGLVFVGLFAILMALYFLLKDSIGVLGTSLLQASLVFVLLCGAVWYRFARKEKAWFFFRVEDDSHDDDDNKPDSDGGSAGDASIESADTVRKAS